MSSIAVIFDHRIKKFLQTRERVRREVEFSSGRVYTAHQSTVFFIWWAVLPNLLKIKEPMIYGEFPHKFIGSASYASGSLMIVIDYVFSDFRG